MITINLLPRSFYEARKSKQRNILIVIGAVLICMAAIGLYINKWSQTRQLQKEIDDVKKQQQAYTETLTKLKEIEADKAFVEKRMGIINDLLKRQAIWPKLMAVFNDTIPQQIWVDSIISSVVAGEQRNFTIKGTSIAKYAVADFVDNIERSGDFAKVNLVNMEEADVLGLKGAKFSITCMTKAGGPLIPGVAVLSGQPSTSASPASAATAPVPAAHPVPVPVPGSKR